MPDLDTKDAPAMDAVTEGADFLVHLAAIPAPHLAPWPEVFTDNVLHHLGAGLLSNAVPS